MKKFPVTCPELACGEPVEPSKELRQPLADFSMNYELKILCALSVLRG
jgi:hypothetical protein